MSRMINLSGLVFGRLTASSLDENCDNSGQRHWFCDCICGNKTRVRASHLRGGKIKSCGCLANELASARLMSHGMYGSRVHRIWSGMLSRCENKNRKSYKNYGGHGVTVCERWHEFENFLADMGEPTTSRHTLDRIKTDGNYEPDNCRWATMLEQQNNRSNNVLVGHGGMEMTIPAWARHTGIPASSIRSRLGRGWTVEMALTQSIRKQIRK